MGCIPGCAGRMPDTLVVHRLWIKDDVPDNRLVKDVEGQLEQWQLAVPDTLEYVLDNAIQVATAECNVQRIALHTFVDVF